MIKAYHIHTTHSDGKKSVDELINLAIDNDVKVLAICDHDTLLGSQEAQKKLLGTGIKLIPGIEISAKNNTFDIAHLGANQSLHILGYHFDLFDESFNTKIRNIRDLNNIMCQNILNNIDVFGNDIRLNEIDIPENRKHYFKTDIAKHLVKLGKTKSVDDAFTKYINNSVNRDFHTYGITISQAIDYIHAANGIAIWAHPFEIFKVANKIPIVLDEVERILISLISFGIDGLEVYYENYTNLQISQLKLLCEKYSLQMIGGSDFHGRINDSFVCSKWEDE